MRIQLYCSLLLSSLLLLACGPEFMYEEEIQLPDNQWNYADSLTYTFQIDDTTARYNLYLDLTHTNQFPFQNLYTMIHTTYPSGRTVDSRISIDLADKLGEWFGKCNSEVCHLRINLQQQTFFKEPGQHTITFEQYTRRDALIGVQAVGFLVEQE